MIPLTPTLSPYSKTVVSAVGTLIAVIIQYLVGNGADAATLGTAVIGLLTTLGVFKVTNAPLPEKGSAFEPSPHEVIEFRRAKSVSDCVALKAKARPRPTSKAVRKTTKKIEV